MTTAARDRSVFINSPFDQEYRPLFDAIVFTVLYCRYDVRSALEEEDSANVRLQKIITLLKASRFSIHDISRVEQDADTGLPRFNMPLELGAAIGLRASEHDVLADHQVLILDTERFRYQRFVSDLAGVDIRGHGGDIKNVIACVRDFLSTKEAGHTPGPAAIHKSYKLFERSLPRLARAQQQKVSELTYYDRLLHLRAFMDLQR